MKSLFILGRQPAIGRAELESLFGAQHLQVIGQQAVACNVNASEIPFARLGGSIRVCEILEIIDGQNWQDVSREMQKHLSRLLTTMPAEGKVKIGISLFGKLHLTNAKLLQTGLELKKTCKKSGHSARIVPNQEPELNSAQVLHNQLTAELGVEFVAIADNGKIWLAKTTAVQDINAYARRDQGRPKRDARIGMLPPKLAQTIINLATGDKSDSQLTVLDPFCGTGVILQEAYLMGYDSYGTDLEKRMIEYSKVNLEWLANTSEGPWKLEVGDATVHKWSSFDTVACETYLGSPLSSWPNPGRLQEIIGNCNVIIEKFLRNIRDQIAPDTKLCVAVPAWHNPNGRIHHLHLLDHLEEIGYNRIRFEYARDEELVYFRPEQIVARQLVVITRK